MARVAADRQHWIAQAAQLALQQQLHASEGLEGASALDRMRPSTVGRLPSRGGGGGRAAASFSGGDYGRRRPTSVPTQPLSSSRHSSLPRFPPQSPLFEGEAEAAEPFELLPGPYHTATEPGHCTPPDPGVAGSRPLSPDAAAPHAAAAERAAAATGPPPAAAAAASTVAAAGPVAAEAVRATGSAAGEAAAAAAGLEAEAARLSEAERASLMGHVALGRGIAASHRAADAEESLLGEIEEIVAMAEHALAARREQELAERRVAPPVPPSAAAAARADGAPGVLPRAPELDQVPPAAPPPVARGMSPLEAALYARAKATAEHRRNERDAEAMPRVAPGAGSPHGRRAEEAMWLATEAERLASDHGMDDAEFERRLLELYPALAQHRSSSAAEGGEGAPPPHAAAADDEQSGEGGAEAEAEGGAVVARGGEATEELIILGASAVGPRGGGGGGGGLPPLSRGGTPGQGERHRASAERPAAPAAALEVGLGSAAVTCEARGDAVRMQPASRPASREAARVATPTVRAPHSRPKPGGLTCEAGALTAHSALPPATSEGRGARRGGAAAAYRPAPPPAAAARGGGEMEERAQSLQALQALLIDIESEAESGDAVESSDARGAARQPGAGRQS